MRFTFTRAASLALAVAIGPLACSDSGSSNRDGGDGTAGGAGTASGGAGGTPGVARTPVSGGTCPQTLVNFGSGPGIVCPAMPGDTCADDDHHCECGPETIEGSAWYCVPTESGCPADLPAGGAACAGALVCDYVEQAERHRCRCTGDSWDCNNIDALCPRFGARAGDPCEGLQGQACSGLDSPTTQDGQAFHVTCVCTDAATWACPDS